MKPGLPCINLLRTKKDLESQRATLYSLHDEIAVLKAEYDADKGLSSESLDFDKHGSNWDSAESQSSQHPATLSLLRCFPSNWNHAVV